MIKTALLLLFASIGFLFGCATNAKRSIAIAVSSASPAAMSPQGLHLAMNALSTELTKRGFLVASSVESADYVMFVRFNPDTALSGGGHLDVVGVQPRGREARAGELEKLQADARSVARELIHAGATPQ